MHACMHAWMDASIHPSIPTYVHTYVRTYIRTYVHTYITLHDITLHYSTLHYIYITYHYITLHCNTIHTYIRMYSWLKPPFPGELPRPPRFGKDFEGKAIDTSTMLGPRSNPQQLTMEVLRQEAPPLARGLT